MRPLGMGHYPRQCPLPGSRQPFAALSDIVPGKEARIERDLSRDRLPVQDPKHGLAAPRRVLEGQRT